MSVGQRIDAGMHCTVHIRSIAYALPIHNTALQQSSRYSFTNSYQVAMGFLTRPVEAFNDTTRGDAMKEGMMGVPWSEADKKTNKRIEEIAKARGTTMAVVAMAWSLSKPFITSPIVGLSSEKRVDEAIEAIHFQLSDEEVKSMDDLYEPKRTMGFS